MLQKHFDRLRHDKLFELLLKRKIPEIALRALLDLYQRQTLRTVWKGHYSRLFSATHGIRQGGVISPMLFCVYIDELLKRLEREGHGCWVGNHFYGAFSYADDMKILCPSVKGLRKIMKICEEFVKVFNTQCGHFYGAQSWNLTDSAIKDFQVMWNRCIRRILEVHFATHTRYLPHLIGTKTALDQISERFVKLVNTMQNSNNSKVTNLVQVCKNTASSILSMNSDFISRE